MKRRDLVTAAAIAVIASGLVVAPSFDGPRGLSLDLLFWLRHVVYGPRHAPDDSPSVVVAIDEETYRRPPFVRLPKVMWTKQIAQVMRAILAGGAAVVGFDVIFPTSVEPFIRGFDRDFLVELRTASRQGKVVLAKVQHQLKPISPFPGYSFAVDHQKNIRAANVFEDGDGVIRRVPLLFRSVDANKGERIDTSLALELAARRAGKRPEVDGRGGVTLDGYAVPVVGNANMLVNFDDGAGTIPTYSLADLFACAEANNDAFFRRHFAGKVVLIGAVLDVEDRKLTSQRFVRDNPDGYPGKRCRLPVMAGLIRTDLKRDTIPGTYIHAAAVNDLLRGDALTELTPEARFGVILAITLAGAAAALLLSAWAGGLVVMTGFALWTAGATWALQEGMVLPLLEPFSAVAITFVALMGYRFAVADRDKRYLAQSFSLYLPPAVVDRLVDSNTPPELGGETRELSCFFSDMAGFTSVSEGLTPHDLVAFLNRYLSVISDTVEEHGGFVDKYIGDAVVGVFGAPMQDPDHAAHAVAAALDCQVRLTRMNRLFGLPGAEAVHTRIGINSGEMLVGNIGSGRRFNYTVIGDAVNLASRLEGANKAYGTRILVSDTTVALCSDSYVFREIDRVRVVGRGTPVAVYEPIGRAGTVTPETEQRLARFADALAAFRARSFDEAGAAFAALCEADPVAHAYVGRVERYKAAPPAPDWDGVTDLESK